MKTLSFCLLLAASVCLLQAQNPPQAWDAIIKVVDESSEPIAGAAVDMSFDIQPPAGETSAAGNVRGFTDTNGLIELTHTNTGSVGLAFEATKSGFYSARIGHDVFQRSDTDPEKWNPHKTLMLKKLIKPGAMYAKHILRLKFPEYNKPIGYDLMIGDWVGPYGSGITSDFLFTENHASPAAGYTFTISFPHPGDGIQGFSRDIAFGVSALLSSHEAPADGYQHRYEQNHAADPNRIYYFRVRTELDHDGNVVSTHYGKIYGDFMQFTYYLNPTVNDRNIEFDPKQNLLQGLQSFEQVRQP